MRTTAGTRELPKPRRRHARNNPEKWCPRCETWKPRTAEHFYRAKTGWQGYCIPCTSSAPRSASNRPGKAEQLKALKDGQRCVDCGLPWRFFQLDYDHRPGEVKIAPVARLMSQNCAWDKILAEVAKCDLVCANCHRMRTFTRGQTKGLTA